MQNIYLSNVDLSEALQKYKSYITPFASKTETIPVSQALNRTTAQAIFALCNSPLYDCAAMDGIAVISEKTKTAREIVPITLRQGDFIPADTGDPILPPYDAVIMVEDVQLTTSGAIIRKAAVSYQHIRAIGEDVVKGELIIPSDHSIRPVDIGALLSGGVTEIIVNAIPKVGIIPTGTELVDPYQKAPVVSKIIETNSYMLEALIKEDNCLAERYPIIPDDYIQLKAALQSAVKNNDIVLICSGTSAGREDYTKQLLEELGEVVVHGLAIKPGKPAILAVVDGKPVIGVPGYPVSAYIVYQNIVSTLLNPKQAPAEITATLAKRLVSSPKHMEFVRVKVGEIDGRYIAAPLPRGAGASMSLVNADGFCIIDKNLEGIEAGSQVKITLLRNLDEITQTLISIGSHDIIMDVLADILPLSSSHVGTMGGLMALKRHECHIAPIHHLDEVSGEYNIPILKQMFVGEKVVLIKGVKRVQGIMVAKGNPLNIMGLADLTRCRYVNRSRGTGTRMFLDYKLKESEILVENINGYEREASTHMNVGSIITSGGADAGLGVLSAALACGLDFIPIGEEDYDFAVYAYTLDRAGEFIDTLKSEKFHGRK